jgi:hypothetical protein
MSMHEADTGTYLYDRALIRDHDEATLYFIQFLEQIWNHDITSNFYCRAISDSSCSVVRRVLKKIIHV